MCYHSKQTKNAVTVEHRFNAKLENKQLDILVTSNHWNGFEFPKTPVITNMDQSHIQLFNWGLIPSWSKDNAIRQHTLNARIETLDEKPSFKHHQDHRCLVIADGFSEWQWLDSKGKKKQPYTLSIQNDELFAFAGIWSEWVDQETGEVTKSYSIVTTEAQRIMREVHNSGFRMPVILRPDQEQAWLSGDDKNHYVDTEVEIIAKTENYQTSLF